METTQEVSKMLEKTSAFDLIIHCLLCIITGGENNLRPK